MDASNLCNQTTEQVENWNNLIFSLTEKLKGLTYSDAKRALEHVNRQLEHNLVLN